MPADNDLDPVDRWLNQQVWPIAPPDGAFEQITKRARRRKVRNAAISVASAAAVVVAAAVAVPLALSGGLGTSGPGPTSVVAGGSSTASGTGSQSPLGSGTQDASPSSTATATALPTPAGSTPATNSGPACITTPGCLPGNFMPASVTWVSLKTGYIIGQAGTPGRCGAQHNSDICTSVAVTHDSGQTWSGLPAPVAGPPHGTTGVGQLRFLNSAYGWAYGPELWSTSDGGEDWKRVPTGGKVVTDLETMNGRAYALWGSCADPAGDSKGNAMANCTAFTLTTSVAGSGRWTAVRGLPAVLSGSKATSSAILELAGSAGSTPATGYLAGPDGNLYSGTLDGGDWSRAGHLPCRPAPSPGGSGPQNLFLTPDGIGPNGKARLAVVCAEPTIADTVVYVSDNGGGSWNEQTSVGSAGISQLGQPESLTAIGTKGTLILATSTGIYLLPAGATQWQPTTLSDPSGTTYGFSYVGMTDSTQGVAIGGSPQLNAIWLTQNAGQSWQVYPIKP